MFDFEEEGLKNQCLANLKENLIFFTPEGGGGVEPVKPSKSYVTGSDKNIFCQYSPF